MGTYWQGSLGMTQIKDALVALIDNRNVSYQQFVSNSQIGPILRHFRSEYSG